MNELIYYDLKQSPGLTHSLSGQVAREIGRRIVAGHYAPRTQIEDEASLAARYGVSRSVIRDAVKVLVGKGLVSVRRGIGTTVTPRSAWGLLDDDVLAWQSSRTAPSLMPTAWNRPHPEVALRKGGVRNEEGQE